MNFFKTLFNSCDGQKNPQKLKFEDWPRLPDGIKHIIVSKMDSSTRRNLSLRSKIDNRVVKMLSKENTSGSVISKNENVIYDIFNWNGLPNELKQHIISEMDYQTRFKLSLCSKSDYQNVDNVKLELSSMSILDENTVSSEQDLRYVIIFIRFASKQDKRLALRISEDFNDKGKCYLIVGKENNDPNTLYDWKIEPGVYKYDSYQIAAFNIIGQFLRKSNFKLEDLLIHMDNPLLPGIFDKSLKYITSFTIDSKNHEYMSEWLEKLGPLKVLSLDYNSIEQDNFTGLVEKVSSHKSSIKCVFFYANSWISEEHILNLNSTAINVACDNRSNLTTRTINKFIRRWIQGNTHENFFQLWVARFIVYDKNELLEELNANEWDDAVRQENRLFCDEFSAKYEGSNFFEIRNNVNDKAAILQFDETNVYFVVTGVLTDGCIIHRMPQI